MTREAEFITQVLLDILPVTEAPEAVLRRVRFALDPVPADIDTLASSLLERELLLGIARATVQRHYFATHGEYPPRGRREFSSTTSDGLLDQDFSCHWSALQWLNMLVLRDLSANRRVAIVVAMRDDGLSMLEWIAHHQVLGADGLFIYSNDNVDKSELLLESLAEAGVVTYIDNHVAQGRSPQRKAFAHALQLLTPLRQYEWVLFLDSDEFFIPGEASQHQLGALLEAIESAHPEQLPSAACFHWRWRTGNWHFRRGRELLADRFPVGEAHVLVKSLVRLRDVYSMGEIHYPEIVPDGFLCDSRLQPLNYVDRWNERVPECSYAAIDHYWCKSFEEFSIKKARGDMPGLAEFGYDRDFSLFFEWGNEGRTEPVVAYPKGWHNAVKKQLKILLANPKVAAAREQVEATLPELRARFDAAGGLEAVFVAALLEFSRARGTTFLELIAKGSSFARVLDEIDPRQFVRGALRQWLTNHQHEAPDKALAQLKNYAARRAPNDAATFFNIAPEGTATQSSLSEWSRGPSPALDAVGAISGSVKGDYGFHTDFEAAPWWCVDLGRACPIREVRLYNRPQCAERATTVVVMCSTDLVHWTTIYAPDDPVSFGVASGEPLRIMIDSGVNARFVRVALRETNWLHLDTVEVYV